MMNQDIDYRAVRRDVEAQVKRRKMAARWIFFGVNLMMFGLFSIIAWSVLSGSGVSDDTIAALVIMSVGWFVGLIFQFISAMMDTKSFEDRIREEAVGQAIGKQLLRLGLDEEELEEKRKRVYSLGDDGELESVPIDETQDVTRDLRDVQSELKKRLE